jgi:hypothetical protein
MDGSRAGEGGPGGTGWAKQISGTNQFTTSDIGQIDEITSQFVEAVEDRGENSGFARWGGVISFDRSGRSWHFDYTTPPSANTTDFFAVAIHELAHTLGFGQKDENPNHATPWESFVSGSSFYGSNSISKYGGPVPLSTEDPDVSQRLSHWAPDTSSVVYGGSTTQETAMDPDLISGTRKRFTELDAAALRDIGWSVIPLPGVNGDFNNNGVVDAADFVAWRDRLNHSVTLPNDPTPGTVTSADYSVWRGNFARTAGGSGAALAPLPEPASYLLVFACVSWHALVRRRRA